MFRAILAYNTIEQQVWFWERGAAKSTF